MYSRAAAPVLVPCVPIRSGADYGREADSSRLHTFYVARPLKDIPKHIPLPSIAPSDATHIAPSISALVFYRQLVYFPRFSPSYYEGP